jgi:hypothetical protein
MSLCRRRATQARRGSTIVSIIHLSIPMCLEMAASESLSNERENSVNENPRKRRKPNEETKHQRDEVQEVRPKEENTQVGRGRKKRVAKREEETKDKGVGVSGQLSAKTLRLIEQLGLKQVRKDEMAQKKSKAIQ